MAKNRLVVPEARQALEQFKMEVAQEFGVDDPRSLASNHTGYIVRKLVEMGEQQLIDNNKNN
ncbi:alpha/beta-type small acid-soluble spore protein [Alkaliphilus sp. MSJ-5]|uniref:Alpha/beta-type small acid-soluble spore protein n=1 Tax=Alkaliphilus flagellatus TaxID=2841507 RepID=A0ABS6G662_9FIRM|nr:alpha/beta-type small acid-soluble spore protein [Alkaliphilus flagellatus]MBU5677621.1 alpha/beta-type small acid-soluble spore protein [Alkaliphilus flagellatus]